MNPTSEEVDISGLDKAEVLLALYHGTRAVGMGVLHDNSNFSIDDAKNVVADSTRMYFDYVSGRPLKVNLSNSTFDPALYDRDAGPGTAAKVIECLREKVSAQQG